MEDCRQSLIFPDEKHFEKVQKSFSKKLRKLFMNITLVFQTPMMFCKYFFKSFEPEQRLSIWASLKIHLHLSCKSCIIKLFISEREKSEKV
jgi:hypothetical protein